MHVLFPRELSPDKISSTVRLLRPYHASRRVKVSRVFRILCYRGVTVIYKLHYTTGTRSLRELLGKKPNAARGIF